MRLTKTIRAKARDAALAHYYRYTKIADIALAAAKIADETIFDLGLHFKLDLDDLADIETHLKTYIKQHHEIVSDL